MAMSKNAPITNFFKKLNHSHHRKRTLPEDGFEEAREATAKKTSVNHSKNDGCNWAEGDTRAQASVQKYEESLPLGQASLSSQQSSPSQAISTPASNNEEALGPSQTPLNGTSPSGGQKPEVIIPAASDRTFSNESHLSRSISTQSEASTQVPAIVSSQITLTSSQRIVRHGEIMIRNSDDESDDSLEDLNDLLERNRPEQQQITNPVPALLHSTIKSDKETARRTRGAGRAKSSISQTLPVLPKTYKFSLEALVEQKRQDEASKEAISQAKSMLESYDQRLESGKKKKGVFDPEFIDSAMKDRGDEDDISRLKCAIERTEALQHGKSWSFFGENSNDSSLEPIDFPAFEDERLQRLFGDVTSRQHTFLGGYAGEYAAKGGLPEELLFWIMDALCVETRDDLRNAYVFTLEEATEYFTPLLTPDYIDIVFRNFGATPAALDMRKAIIPYHTFAERVKITNRPILSSVLMLLGSLAVDMTTDSRRHLLNVLCRLALDSSITKDSRLLNAVEQSLARVIDSIPEADPGREIHAVLASTYQNISDTNLRLQLLQIIPAWSPRLISFRQQLALAIFFKDVHYISEQPEKLLDLKLIAQRLQYPTYNINHATDFAELAASISILSIGIDCGNPPILPMFKEQEREFNKDVDLLSSITKDMSDDIVDTGATHMRRTEAKEVLDQLQRRLQYAVRTKPKRKNIFGDAELKPMQEQMETWLQESEAAC